MTGFFDKKIEFLKGVGPQRAALLNSELEIFTYADLIHHYAEEMGRGVWP